ENDDSDEGRDVDMGRFGLHVSSFDLEDSRFVSRIDLDVNSDKLHDGHGVGISMMNDEGDTMSGGEDRSPTNESPTNEMLLGND
ncbi:hypothetical protein Dimus_036982, partial [Dionaea muscipula]